MCMEEAASERTGLGGQECFVVLSAESALERLLSFNHLRLEWFTGLCADQFLIIGAETSIPLFCSDAQK